MAAAPMKDSIVTPDFVEYIKEVEDAESKKGSLRKEVVFMPYPSPEKDGTFTIGYGHKLALGEEKNYQQGLSQEEAEKILAADIQIAATDAENAFGSAWQNMDLNQRQIATEYIFNMGPDRFVQGFPEFIKGLVKGDYDKMGAEFHRKSSQVGKRRNELFYDKFLSPHTDVKQKDPIREITPDRPLKKEVLVPADRGQLSQIQQPTPGTPLFKDIWMKS